MSEQLISKKRYTLAVDGGSIQYEVDPDKQTATFSVNIEALANQLMSDDNFKNEILSAVAKQLTGQTDADADTDLTEYIGETAVDAVASEILNNSTTDTTDDNNLYNILARQIVSNQQKYHPVIIHGTSAPDATTITNNPNAYIYIQHE